MLLRVEASDDKEAGGQAALHGRVGKPADQPRLVPLAARASAWLRRPVATGPRVALRCRDARHHA